MPGLARPVKRHILARLPMASPAPAQASPMRWPRPRLVGRGLRRLAPLGFLFAFGLAVFGITDNQSILASYLPQASSGPSCYRLFVNALGGSGEAHGVWPCMSEKMKQSWFRGNAWGGRKPGDSRSADQIGDTDINTWLKQLRKDGAK